MNFVFSRERVNLPKYVMGSKPYVIDVSKLLAKLRISENGEIASSSAYLLNITLQEEFQFAVRKRKSSVLYVNPKISLDTVKNIKRLLPELEVNVKKYFLVDDGELKKIHKHVDQVVKPR